MIRAVSTVQTRHIRPTWITVIYVCKERRIARSITVVEVAIPWFESMVSALNIDITRYIVTERILGRKAHLSPSLVTITVCWPCNNVSICSLKAQ